MMLAHWGQMQKRTIKYSRISDEIYRLKKVVRVTEQQRGERQQKFQNVRVRESAV
jgi:hypothetical protein